jgi:hypothetical protein
MGIQPLRIFRAPASPALPCHTANATAVREPSDSPSGSGRMMTTAHPSGVRTPVPREIGGAGVSVPGPSATRSSTADVRSAPRTFPAPTAGA